MSEAMWYPFDEISLLTMCFMVNTSSYWTGRAEVWVAGVSYANIACLCERLQEKPWH